jgi:hypothetical protein
MSQLGRISGPLLKANLVRDGVNLAFENDLLYLDVNHARIGVNTATPQYDLDVNGNARTGNLEVLNTFDIGNFTVSGNTISSDQPVINFVAAGGEPTVYHSRLIVNDIEFDSNVISTIVTNSNLEIRPSGTGIVDIKKSTSIDGNLSVTGTILDSNGEAGTSGQILSSTGTGTDWIDASGGGGSIDGSGTANKITKWLDADTITDSVLQDDGVNVGLSVTPNDWTSFRGIQVGGGAAFEIGRAHV